MFLNELPYDREQLSYMAEDMDADLIASGCFTAVFEPSYLFTPSEVKEKFNSPVLVASMEPHKMELFSVLSGCEVVSYSPEQGKQDIADSWLEDQGFESMEQAEEEEGDNMVEYAIEEHMPFDVSHGSIMLEQEGAIFYWTEKLDIMEDTEKESEEEKGGYALTTEFADSCINEAIQVLMTNRQVDPGYIHSELLFALTNMFHFSKMRFKVTQKSAEIIRAILKAAKVIEKNASEIFYQRGIYVVDIDIHDKQFVRVDERLVCIDPVIVRER